MELVWKQGPLCQPLGLQYYLSYLQQITRILNYADFANINYFFPRYKLVWLSTIILYSTSH